MTEIHPLVVAKLRTLTAEAELKVEQVRSKRDALPGSPANHAQVRRLYKQLIELARIRDSWDLVFGSVSEDSVDERSVPGE
jgi:hypothetical protein